MHIIILQVLPSDGEIILGDGMTLTFSPPDNSADCPGEGEICPILSYTNHCKLYIARMGIGITF